MKFTLSWLYEHLDTQVDIKIIETKLNNIGLEVETIQNRRDELKHFTVAEVINVKKHPDADRLKVCDVKTNNGNFQVVCGAPNVKAGMLGIFAPENSYIPGTKFNLKKSKIRGIESQGMLVSEREMGISDEHKVIIEIDQKYQIGDLFSEIFGLNDPIIEINVTPNRSDCLSVRGVARDLAATGIGELKKLEIKKIEGSFDSQIKWQRKFNKDEEKLCPGVSGRFFKNIKNVESPDWLKNKLLAIGLRPISTLVDITNYITFDLGRPLHVYDADKINGNLSMRLAKDNEKCKTLDEKEYTLSSNMIVIADDSKLHGIGGVMGGMESGCSISTTNVFLEVALFDPISVTKTGRKLNLQSDARYRFERGIDNTSINWGVDKATEMILELCGGEASKITKDTNYKMKEKIIKYNFNKVHSLGGLDFDKKNQEEIFNKLGFKLSNNDSDQCNVKVPPYRPDIEGEADLVEEVLRIYGFDKIKPQSVTKDSKIKKEILNNNLKTFYKSKRIIASRGYFETVTWSFISSEYASFRNGKDNVKIKNPISVDLDIMRSSIFPNLLNSINTNISRLYNNGKLFEVGPQFSGVEEKDQQMLATGINYGSAHRETWNSENRASDVFDIKSDVFFILEQLNVPIENLFYEKIEDNFYHPGKSAKLKIGKNVLAQYGEIHPFILQKFDIKTNVYGFEIDLDKISQFQIKKISTKSAYDNNSLQAIERDFAFLFNENITAIDIINTVKKIEKERIKKVIIFDVFVDKKLFKNMKSIAFKVVLQPIENTFTDNEIEKLSKKIISNVSNSLGGQLRQ